MCSCIFNVPVIVKLYSLCTWYSLYTYTRIVERLMYLYLYNFKGVVPGVGQVHPPLYEPFPRQETVSACTVSTCTLSTCTFSTCTVKTCTVSTCTVSICSVSTCTVSTCTVSTCAVSTCTVSTCTVSTYTVITCTVITCTVGVPVQLVYL